MGKQGFLECRNRRIELDSFFSVQGGGWNGVKFGKFAEKRYVKNSLNRTYLYIQLFQSRGMEHFLGQWSSLEVS